MKNILKNVVYFSFKDFCRPKNVQLYYIVFIENFSDNVVKYIVMLLTFLSNNLQILVRIILIWKQI